MKRIFIWIFFLSFYLNTSALNESCFEYIWTTDIPQNEIFLLNTERVIDYAKTQNWDLYMKLYKQDNKNLDYNVNISSAEKAFIQDNNGNTYYTMTLWDKTKSNSLILDFNQNVWPWVNAFINIDSINYDYYISISSDNINYNKISLYNLNTFSFRYIKIDFTYKFDSDDILENIKINDLIFTKNDFTYLVKWNNWSTAKLFSNFYCSNWKDYSDLQTYNNDNYSEEKSFMYKTWLKQVNISLVKNISYSLDKWTDTDWDWINDEEDNCKSYYNTNQLDTNTNGIWDICDDDDSDWIIWKNDNCPFNSNADQKDINNNKIWDVCEFDKDRDSIFDSLDNCINKANSDQKDSDDDSIWDICDNCKLYNPTQLDKNNNNIWDTCEETEKFEKENDVDKDKVIDYIDNCKEILNPLQEDGDVDWIWDVCDNCKDIRNNKQEDENKNNIWDLCEDSDADWILWYLDNCINIPNTDQKDSDNNWVWDLCEDDDSDSILTFNDNCPYDYNPDQKDIDNDKIWDTCDDKDNRFIESNKVFFISFIVFMVLVFVSWIFLMFKKLQNVKK